MNRCHFALRCRVSVQMLCNRAGLTLRVRVMTCLSSFPKNELKGGSETSSFLCKVFKPIVYTRTAAPRARVSASRLVISLRSWNSSGQCCVGSPLLFCDAPGGNNVSCAVGNFSRGSLPLLTTRLFFLFTPSKQCSKQTAAANTISTLSQWSCHGSHCSYLCSGFSEVPVVNTEFRYSLRLCRQKSHTPLQL